MRPKPGYKTSEFWFTLVSFIFSGLYLTGILTENEHKEELITVVSHAVESVILISGQVWILARYIRGRNEVKKTTVEEQEKNNESKRTNSRTSRKSSPRTKKVTNKPKKRSIK